MQTAPVFQPTKSKYLVVTTDYLLPALILLVVVSLWWIVFHTAVFTVKTVNCTFDFSPCQDPAVLAELNKYRGANLITFDTSKLTARFTSAEFTIRGVTVERRLPDTLSVSFVSVYPVVAAKLANLDSWMIFDDKTRLIGLVAKDPNVPTLIVPSLPSLPLGKPVADPALLQAFSAVQLVRTEVPTVRSVELVDSATLKLYLNEWVVALLTTAKDEVVQLQTLQAVLKNPSMLQGIHTIDVRFNQPVLKP